MKTERDMETKTSKEKDIDSDRPSTIRIIAGSLVMLCYILIFWICLDGMVYFMNHYPPRKFPYFEYLWGKLAFIFISGMIVIITIGISMSLIFAAVKIWGGKSESPGHVIYPFPAVLTSDIAGFYKAERADDRFLIFNAPTVLRGFLIGLEAFLLCTGIYMFCTEMDDPHSDIYEPLSSGLLILLPLILLANQWFTRSRRFVLDRMNGTITFPRHLFFPRCTVPFSKVTPIYARHNFCLAHPRTKLGIPVLGAYDSDSDWWPFYVLYMDKNRPLPQGDVFDPYREKDFLRRKAAGFPKPIYPNTILVTDAYMGYIYGTDEFKQRLSKIKHRIVHYYDRVSWYCQEHGIEIPNDNDLVLIGLWKKQFVFKLFAPENIEYIVIPDNTVLTDCFLCDSETDEVKYIK